MDLSGQRDTALLATWSELLTPCAGLVVWGGIHYTEAHMKLDRLGGKLGTEFKKLLSKPDLF